MSHDTSTDGYEEDPWGDDQPVSAPADDFLPPAERLAHAFLQTKENGAALYMLSAGDFSTLQAKAETLGVSVQAMMASVLHDYAAGNLIHRSER